MSLEDLRDEVVDNGGVRTVKVSELREAVGKGKMGNHVAEEIRKGLDKLNIGHFPLTIPHSQHENVLLYDKSKEVKKIINAVVHPSQETDRYLLNSDKDGVQQLNRVKDLVEELLQLNQ